MIRKRFFDELSAVAQGFEPKGIIRNSNVAQCVELPNMERERCVEGVWLEDFETIPILKARLQGFRWQYGQPPEVRRAFEEAVGIASCPSNSENVWQKSHGRTQSAPRPWG